MSWLRSGTTGGWFFCDRSTGGLFFCVVPMYGRFVIFDTCEWFFCNGHAVEFFFFCMGLRLDGFFLYGTTAGCFFFYDGHTRIVFQ